MKASLSELQKELALLERKEVLELCIRLAKYKKENKEYLSYLVFSLFLSLIAGQNSQS